jgi:tetratricopeptide (TPR) repeat protein
MKAAVAKYREAGLPLDAAAALRTYGFVLAKQGDATRAGQMFEESREIFLSQDDRPWKIWAAMCLQDLAELARERGELAEAHRLFRGTAREFGDVSDRLNKARCLQRLGFFQMIHQRDPVGAQKTLQEALVECCSFGEQNNMLDKIGYLELYAEIQTGLGEVEDALLSLDEAVELAQTSGKRGQLERLYELFHQCGLIKMDREEWPGARNALRRALEGHRSVGNLEYVTRAFQMLGYVEGMLGEFESGEEKLEEAMRLFDGMGDLEGVRDCKWRIDELGHRRTKVRAP